MKFTKGQAVRIRMTEKMGVIEEESDDGVPYVRWDSGAVTLFCEDELEPVQTCERSR